jgi:hypothetical protein
LSNLAPEERHLPVRISRRRLERSFRVGCVAIRYAAIKRRDTATAKPLRRPLLSVCEALNDSSSAERRVRQSLRGGIDEPQLLHADLEIVVSLDTEVVGSGRRVAVPEGLQSAAWRRPPQGGHWVAESASQAAVLDP